MNILLINHYAGSPEMGMEFRPYYFAKEWVKKGHDVSILAANYSHLRKKNILIKKSFENQNIDGINYIWIKTPKYSGNGISRLFNIFFFVIKTYFNASNLAKQLKPDIIIASSTYPSDNYVAKKIAKLSGGKHIYEVHDLWPLSPMELGKMSKYHPFIMLMQHAENFAYKHCDAVISLLPNTLEYMQSHGLNPQKWFYVPNGINPDEWANPSPIPQDLDNIIKELKNNNKLIIGYAGGHALSNSLETLIDSAYLLKDFENIYFLLVGNGVEKDKLIQKANSLKIKNIIFYDSIQKNSIPTLLSKMDILILGTKKSILYKYGVSMNKLMDYMMAEKPIIQYISTEYDIIKIAQAGISCESENPKQLAEKILEMTNLPIEKRKKFGENGKNFVFENHSNPILAEKCLEIFTKIKQN